MGPGKSVKSETLGRALVMSSCTRASFLHPLHSLNKICNKMDDLVEMEAMTLGSFVSLHKYTVFILGIPVSLVNLLSPPVKHVFDRPVCDIDDV